MCGILGVTPGQYTETFTQALNLLEHRGPDGFGTWTDEENRITLGHRRLSILDLSENGAQPMAYDRYMITYNGEIFNFLEVREELIAKGYHFNNDSDTEVILAAYKAYGPDCLHKFNGMWAFAIWDREKKELFLARDRFGIKPLFYAFIGDKFVFSSEMKGIFPFLPQLSLSSDFSWCQQHIYEYESTDKCLIDGIKRFPAGHYAYVDLDKREIKPQQFWNTLDHLEEAPKRYEDQVERFRELFVDACRIRMRSDVSIGASLSGGIDSSSILCTMFNIGQDTRTSNDWQHAFVARFQGTELDESYYAKMVVDHLGIKATFNDIDPVAGIDKLNRYLYLFEDIYSTSPIPMMDHYGGMREHGIVVSLDGQGADELFCSYGAAPLVTIQDNPFNPKLVANAVGTFAGLAQIDNKIMDLNFKERINMLSEDFHMGTKEIMIAYYRYLLKGERQKEDLSKGILGYFNQHLYNDFHNTTIPTLLRNYDRYSMGHGVEIRLPFMDYRLVKYCFSLPHQSKIRKGFTKSLLRDAMVDFMPKEVIKRKSKVSFGTPFTVWMKGPWKQFLLDTLHSKEFEYSQVLDSKSVKARVENVINNPLVAHTEGERTWSDLMPFFWEKAVLNCKVPALVS